MYLAAKPVALFLRKSQDMVLKRKVQQKAAPTVKAFSVAVDNRAHSENSTQRTFEF